MKLRTITALMASAVFFLASCGGINVEKDVKSVAAAECKLHEAALKMRQNPDDAAAEEAYKKVEKELEELTDKMEKKYKGKKEQEKKAEELYKAESDKCQAKKDLQAWEEEQARLEEEARIAADLAFDSLLNAANTALEQLESK